MRDIVIVLGSSSSAITHPHHHHRRRRGRCRSAAGDEPNRNAKSSSSLTKVPPSPPQQHSAVSSPAPISTVHSRSLRLSTAARCDPNGSVEYYADLASKLAEDGRLQDFALIAENLAAASGTKFSLFAALLDFDLLARGILLNLQQCKIESVIQTVERIKKLGITAVDPFDESSLKLLRKQFIRMVNSGQVEEAVGFMEILAGFRFKIKEVVDPFDIVKICVDNSNPKLAIRYACLLPHAQILFCKIIQGFGKKGDMVSVMAAYEICKQILDTPNMYICRTVIDTCGLCGDHVRSRYIYEDILKQGITPNVYVLNSLMNVNSHDLAYTLEVYQNMQRLNVAVDMTSYNILLKACCLARRVDLAQDIYKEAKRMESSGRLKLDAFTYCTIIKVFADAKLWKMALKVKQDMQSAGIKLNTHTWSSLIRACANVGLVEQANQLFEEMLAAGCEPNSQCFNILLHACVEACQYDRAFRLFQSWKGSSVQEAFLADDVISNGGISIPNKMKKHGLSSRMNGESISPCIRGSMRFSFKPTTATYNILLKACGTDYHRGKDLMDEMKSLGLEPNHISWSTLINMCGCSGNVEAAIKIFRNMLAAGTKPDVVVYTTTIKVCVESKKLKLAFSLFEEMRRYQIKPNLVTYNTLLRARSKYGSLHEVRQCLAIYQDMRRAGYKPNDYFLKQLIEEWCEGVMQEDSQNRDEVSNQKGTNLGRPVSLLIEKVATHLQERTAENLAIDLQGLTKVEARIVVLAVLRKIKEEYMQGDFVRDDVLIILGTGEANTNSKQEITVKDALMKLVKDELALEVLPAKPKRMQDTNLQSMDNSDQNEDQTLENRESVLDVASTRRPADLQRLMVTKESLHQWLQRRNIAAPDT